MQVKITVVTAEHIGDRPTQQDRVAVFFSSKRPEAVLVMVADGVGGRTGGAMASDQVVSTGQRLFDELSPYDATARDLLSSIAHEAHLAIRLSAVTSEKEPHSTMVALIVERGCASWAHAGDSRLYHLRDGALVAQTVDHNMDGHAFSGSGVTRNVLTSALGISRDLQIDFGEVPDLRVGDVFILCSDGLHAYLETDDLVKLVETTPPRAAAEWAVGLARRRARGRGDNLALAIVRVDPD